MGSELEQMLHPAAELPGDLAPRRLTLRLGDAYETSVYVHAARGACRRAPVLYVHGIQSHPGWFVASASALAGGGHPVYQVTRRGSGDNVAARGHAESAKQLLRDVHGAVCFALDHAGADRLHLLGVSWGGKLLAAYAACCPDAGKIASLTMVAPGIASRVSLGWPVKLAVGLSLVCCPGRSFAIPLDDPALFTDNDAMREYLRGDGLALHRATARLLLASRRLDRVLKAAPRGGIAVATALLLASRDSIIDNAATESIVQRLCADQCTVQHLDGAHMLEFEPDPKPLHDALRAAMEGDVR